MQAVLQPAPRKPDRSVIGTNFVSAASFAAFISSRKHAAQPNRKVAEMIPNFHLLIGNVFAVLANLPKRVSCLGNPESKVLPCRPRMCCPVALANDGDMVRKNTSASTNNFTDIMCGTCGANPARRCCACASRSILYGTVSADEDARWVAFYCRGCVEAVRPLLPDERLRPLRRQWCLTCRRTAIYGPAGRPPKEAVFCQRHKVRTDLQRVLLTISCERNYNQEHHSHSSAQPSSAQRTHHPPSCRNYGCHRTAVGRALQYACRDCGRQRSSAAAQLDAEAEAPFAAHTAAAEASPIGAARYRCGPLQTPPRCAPARPRSTWTCCTGAASTRTAARAAPASAR